jgi:hypothetical protein
MIATSSWIEGLGVAIPLVIVFGIFVVSPLVHRNRWQAWSSTSGERSRLLAENQKQILDEIRAVRAQLDEVQRVLAAVE